MSTSEGEGLTQTVLVVDTENDFLEWVEKYLGAPTVKILTCLDAESALKIFAEQTPDLVIAELRLPPFNGMDLLRRIRQQNPNAMVVLTTGFPPTTSVIEAMKLGAYEFLRKESLIYDLRPVVESALKAGEEMRSVNALSDAESEKSNELTAAQLEDSIIGKSAAMQDVFKLIGRVSGSDAPVLITGESGSGKEVVASAIHKFSPRAQNEFVAINCAAIPENLLESELFGHEKGSFTGATAQRIGRFEQCDGGTLFLDEIGDMPFATQSKILRVLQEGEVTRVGGNANIHTDVRILAATNKKLEREVEEGAFREDLFYRLNVVRIHIPPLRERNEDIRLLANFFLQRLSIRKGGPRLRFSDDALAFLEAYEWPGNVRELENTVQRACVLATADVLLPKDLPLGNVPKNPNVAETPQVTAPGAPWMSVRRHNHTSHAIYNKCIDGCHYKIKKTKQKIPQVSRWTVPPMRL